MARKKKRLTVDEIFRILEEHGIRRDRPERDPHAPKKKALEGAPKGPAEATRGKQKHR